MMLPVSKPRLHSIAGAYRSPKLHSGKGNTWPNIIPKINYKKLELLEKERFSNQRIFIHMLNYALRENITLHHF